mmetsp:Transcript_7598/g.28508  ORF Transcript_7598/g.28508 Transcript_7598/m.28508 type:complete len:569 (+) Transcript_7598:1142-2848(+)
MLKLCSNFDDTKLIKTSHCFFAFFAAFFASRRATTPPPNPSATRRTSALPVVLSTFGGSCCHRQFTREPKTSPNATTVSGESMLLRISTSPIWEFAFISVCTCAAPSSEISLRCKSNPIRLTFSLKASASSQTPSLYILLYPTLTMVSEVFSNNISATSPAICGVKSFPRRFNCRNVLFRSRALSSFRTPNLSPVVSPSPVTVTLTLFTARSKEYKPPRREGFRVVCVVVCAALVSFSSSSELSSCCFRVSSSSKLVCAVNNPASAAVPVGPKTLHAKSRCSRLCNFPALYTSTKALIPASPMLLNPSCSTRSEVDLELETNVGSDMIPAQNATTPGSPKPQCAKSILRNVQHRLSAAPKLKQASTPSGLSRKLNRVIGTFEVNAFPIALAPISPIKLDPKSNHRRRHVGLRRSGVVLESRDCLPISHAPDTPEEVSSSSSFVSSPSTANIPSKSSPPVSPWPSSGFDSLRRLHSFCFSHLSTRAEARFMASASLCAPGHLIFAFLMPSLVNGHPRPSRSHASATPSQAPQASFKPQLISSENTLCVLPAAALAASAASFLTSFASAP